MNKFHTKISNDEFFPNYGITHMYACINYLYIYNILFVSMLHRPVSMSLGKDNGLYSYTEDGNKVPCRYRCNKTQQKVIYVLYTHIQVPGVLIFRFNAPLCFTNAQFFISKLAAACNVDPENYNTSSNIEPGCIDVAHHKVIPVLCSCGFCSQQYLLDAYMYTHAHTHTHKCTHTYIYNSGDLVCTLQLQLSCCTQNAVTFENEAIQLESQPTCIANGHAHDDNINIQISCSEISEEQIANGNQDQLSQCPDIQ